MVIVDVWASIVAKVLIYNDGVPCIYIHPVEAHKEILWIRGFISNYQ